jgi:glycosyltransferase involved in cell wall biosynthesis
MERHRKPRLLLVLPIVPWPARRNGISIRFAPIITRLVETYDVDLLVLAEDPETPVAEGPLQQCRSVTVLDVPMQVMPAWLRKIRTLCVGLSPWGAPFGSLRPVARAKLRKRLVSHLRANDYSTVVWGGFYLDIACAVRRAFPGIRFVIDVIDSPTLLFSRAKSTPPLLRLLSGYTAWKWRRLERQAQDTFDATIYISRIDALAARGEPSTRVHTIPNGVFVADAPHRVSKEARAGKVIGFLGDMSYAPNISAVLRLAQRLFPKVLQTVPETRLLIIGRNPAPEIRALQGAGITVTGTVEDIWPYIAQTDVFVFPMVEGAGLQNKILEAMHAEVPVITTSLAATGLGAVNAQQLLIGDTDEELVAHILRLLGDEQFSHQLAARAREFVNDEFAWKSILARYEALLAPAA